MARQETACVGCRRLETLLAYHQGALEEILRELNAMSGGWPARVRAVLVTMLGEKAEAPGRRPLV